MTEICCAMKGIGMHSTCYLSFNFSKTPLPVGTEICPEHNMNGKQIKAWVKSLKKKPRKFSTCSLFLLRELYLQDVSVEYTNYESEDSTRTFFDVDAIGRIEVLDRELDQAEVYMNHEIKPQG